jgi:hypothetical protein
MLSSRVAAREHASKLRHVKGEKQPAFAAAQSRILGCGNIAVSADV